MTVEGEWSAIVQPWTRDLQRLGFSFLERSVRNGIPPSPKTTFSCADFYFDGADTFLDLQGLIARGRHHRGLLIGFNGIQLYTFVHAGGEQDFVVTNGTPPNAPSTRWPLFFRWIEERLPEHAKPLRMQSPDDVALVVETHRVAVAGQRGEVVSPDSVHPLEWRWEMMKEFE